VKNEVDPGFNNDNYWLLFPFHAYWDTSADVKDLGVQKLPLGKGSATRVAVKYPAEVGGYTPGDTWELFVSLTVEPRNSSIIGVDPRSRVSFIATWAGYKKAGPLLISTDHRGTADGKPLHIFLF